MPIVHYRSRRIEYEVHGSGPAVPLLLATGTGGSYKGWLPLQVPELSKRGRVVLFNHRGVGASDDDGKPFTTADLADDMVGLLDALQIPTADVLGAFMGGMAAQELALQHPARLRRLVLTGTYARADAKRRMLLDHWASLAARGFAMDAMVRERMLWSLQDETLAQTDLIQGMVEYLSKGDLPMTADLFARQCMACMEHDTYDRLRRIQHPTLVVSGRNDQLTPPRLLREIADEVPDARLVTIRFAAHLVMVEAAERFNQLVADFLDEH
ncbi:MAG: alpha/beta fold hydrolase [Myxococcota bacterium]|nr:alpha/beta fold hydrolase [Myxococcales bacterium]